MVTKDEREGAQAFVDRMLVNTQRLMLIENDRFKSAASGIIVKIGERYFLLSAGHVLIESGTWIIETNAQIWPPKMLVLRVPDPVAFDSTKEDFGWAEINLPAIMARFRQDLTIGHAELVVPYYQGPLDVEPTSDMPYGFASYKAVEYHACISKLWREFRYEINMQFAGLDDRNGLYRFRLNRAHQGHDYYYGCSGAPIADVMGRIVSLVIEGQEDPKEGIIWGTPLARYAGTIGRK
jgi:hypothetical protein